MALAEILTMPKSKERDKVVYLNPQAIAPNPSQPRKLFDQRETDELAESIRACGIIQPLIVRTKQGGYELIAGERRLRAAKQAGLSEVPCILSQADETRSTLMALTENIQRKDLDYFEEAQGIERILQQSGETQEAAAARLGKSQSYIANKLRLLKLDPECVMLLRGSGLSERHARALLRLENPAARLKVLKQIIKTQMKVEQAERYIDGMPRQDDKHQTLKPIIKDIRLMLNTINRAVELVSESGIKATCQKEETDDKIKLVITIKK